MSQDTGPSQYSGLSHRPPCLPMNHWLWARLSHSCYRRISLVRRLMRSPVRRRLNQDQELRVSSTAAVWRRVPSDGERVEEQLPWAEVVVPVLGEAVGVPPVDGERWEN